ncbi:hydroxyethylthiazole kinase [Viridibacillus soli]|uniref:hydroxyethylthiazole kinase n=1 Tax=Viridibacillus soli TaxID=2798301 RepID=UPI002D81069D|nr:hydroxyethylthiazole kinase [Viridibacillus soli]
MTKQHLLEKVRTQKPLIHNITNIVVANFQANGLIALGASPIMAQAIEEVAAMSSHADCTVLNIGTLDHANVLAMIIAGKSANQKGTPVVLDPVGVGASEFRKQSIANILREVKVTIIRCNAGELAALANVDWQAKGVDAGEGQLDVQNVAEQVAKQHNCIVAVTGVKDTVTDGQTTFQIEGGHNLMPLITGSGCLLSAVTGAFLAVADGQNLQATATALAFYKQVGENAAQNAIAPGTFAVELINSLYSFTSEDLRDNMTIVENTGIQL